MNDFNLSTFGFDMYKVDTRDGSVVFEVDTPFLLADEYSLSIFVEQVGNHIHIFDEGCTLFDLRGFGIRLDDRKMKSLTSLLGRYELGLDGTSIEAFSPISQAPVLFSRYIAAMMGIDDWIRTNLRVKPSRMNLVNEAKTYFQTWTGNNQVIDKPKVRGKGKKVFEFDFFIEDLYVDSIFPEHNSTASFMHKVAFAKLTNEISTMAVIDDSTDPEKAKGEVEVVSTVSYAISLSTLKLNAINCRQFDVRRYGTGF